MWFRCECGATEVLAVIPPPRCTGCTECGTRLSLHGSPPYQPEAPHEYTVTLRQKGLTGPVEVPVCKWCERAEWENAA